MIRLLLVDDDPDILDILGEYLRELGYDVVSAATGTEASNAVQKYHFAGVVLDWSLPDVSGADVLSLLKTAAPGCPVIVTTGHTRETIPTEAPVSGVMRKPYSLRALALRLEALTEKAGGAPRR
jgi:DNA-binding response OmpR family regulator